MFFFGNAVHWPAIVVLTLLLKSYSNACVGAPSYFRVQLVGSDMCLQPSSRYRNGSQYIIIDNCDDSRREQMWRLDSLGRLQSLPDHERCIQKKNDKDLILGYCENKNFLTNFNNQFIFNENLSPGLIKWKRNENNVFTVFGKDTVYLDAFNRNIKHKARQIWLMKFVSSVEGDENKLSYLPGDLRVRENGLLLSIGLTSRIIAKSGQVVQYTGNALSRDKFHQNPDGAAIFEIVEGENKGGWLYVSNSEVWKGGVGMLTFDRNGEVINYEMIVTGTRRNCGGGRTPWKTWVTCEEIQNSGQVYEVDPYTGKKSLQITVLGGKGGNYESFAYDARGSMTPTFYVTNDSQFGGMLRFTPDPSVLAYAKQTGDYKSVLTSEGTKDWLVLEPKNDIASATSGKFRWTSSRIEGDQNSNRYYAFSEGIDIRDGLLFFTCKKMASLFTLTLDDFTYTKSSTKNGKFDGQPDTIVRILNENNTDDDMLYFCEDGQKKCGVHARNKHGQYFTILEGEQRYYGQETTGLAFSPNNSRMYLCFQDSGMMYEIRRKDGYSFGADYVRVK